MLSKSSLLRLCKARDTLRDAKNLDVSIAEVASTAAMSQFHFIRRFKSVFGETPARFRTRSRLQRANHMLINGDESITNICMAVGFASLGSFSSLYARHFGHSPSEHRRQSAGAPESPADCLSLLRSAWELESQFSRSAQETDSLRCLSTPTVEGK